MTCDGELKAERETQGQGGGIGVDTGETREREKGKGRKICVCGGGVGDTAARVAGDLPSLKTWRAAVSWQTMAAPKQRDACSKALWQSKHMRMFTRTCTPPPPSPPPCASRPLRPPPPPSGSRQSRHSSAEAEGCMALAQSRPRQRARSLRRLSLCRSRRSFVGKVQAHVAKDETIR